MSKGRLEAFSDGVIAIIITIMVLELHRPAEATLGALVALAPDFLGYVVSFVYVGIYWNNHHHLLHVSARVSGSVLWANLHLLFWLSLIPFTTAWIGATSFASLPMALYGGVLFMAAIAYTLLVRRLVRLHGNESVLARAIGSDRKGYLSLASYAAAIPLAFVHPALAGALYIFVALVWLVPDRRIESRLPA